MHKTLPWVIKGSLYLYLLLILMQSPLSHVNCCVEHDVKDKILERESNGRAFFYNSHRVKSLLLSLELSFRSLLQGRQTSK